MLLAGAAAVLLAWWLRDPLIPYGGDTSGASSISADSGFADEPGRRAGEAVEAMSAAVRAEHAQLARIASSALTAPASPGVAFAHLGKLPHSPPRGVLLLEGGLPLAWAGELRQIPRPTGQGTSVQFSEFYVTLQVVAERGARQAIATSVLHAEPPADGIAPTLESLLPERDFVRAFRYRPASDTTAGLLITGATGSPLIRVDALPLSSERMRFATSAAARGKGVALLALIVFAMIAVGWFDRRKLIRRIFTLGVAAVAVAIIPWNTFSNLSRVFDPAFFYSTLFGPFTSSSGAYLMFASLVLLAVIAVIRARRTKIPRALALAGAVATLAGGIFAVRETAQGISLPFWGSTATLWLQWELPLFLLLFAGFLTSTWLARIALGRRPMVHLRTAALVAVAAGAISAFAVWNVTTEQRLQLAMRDVAGLQRTDVEASLLLTRFGQQLSVYDTPGTRADLLKRYAVSDLAAAEVQVSLSAWTPQAVAYETLDLAPLRYDSTELAASVAAADTAAGPTVAQSVGPTGRQLTLVVPHRGGGSTTVVASPRTRLVAQDQYAALLGFAQPDRTEPPYLLTLADVSPRASATADAMTWRRVGNEWHGDQVMATSNGPARAHVEVDIRTWGTRLVRASLIVILDVIVAGLLWAFGAMAEGGFVRWVRGRASRWVLSYRGRLTLALFTFFVVPAVAFGAWSYQRLRGDDRDVRELLVRETLFAASGESPLAQQPVRSPGSTPLFLYSSAMLTSSSDALFEMIAPSGRMLPAPVYTNIAYEGELTASWQQTISNSKIFWGYRAATTPAREQYVLAAPARSDEVILDRRRRDLTMLVLFATAVGALAALWLSGIAARVLARDLELSKLETARAERILAWGEMARQVAHEIKNPLTPIRLGVQHLRRARADKRIDFDRVLDENVTRILSEIDRLDEIARAFSRYGSAPSDLPPPEPVDVAAILRDVVGLERMGIGGVTWSLSGADAPAFAQARSDELRDVLLNVFENARLARARNVVVDLTRSDKFVTIEVADDGAGIPSATLPRVFEPHFSTRTTGSGLGLAITRRLLESWGGTIEIASEEGRGARLLINLHAVET